MRRKVLVAMPLLLLAGVVFSATLGHAVPVCRPPLPAGASDLFTVCAPDGSVFESLTVSEGGIPPAGETGGPYILNATLPPGFPPLVNLSQFGNATTLCEAAPCNKNVPSANLSDVFGVFHVNGGFFLGFESDGIHGPPPDARMAANFLVELGGKADDATMYLDDFYTLRGYTASFVSDSNVPEPGSMLLLGSGAIGLAGVLRRKLMR